MIWAMTGTLGSAFTSFHCSVHADRWKQGLWSLEGAMRAELSRVP